MKLIALDMDGVLADFMSAAQSHFDVPAEPGGHQYEEKLGISWSLMMRTIESPGFWYRLPVLPDAERIVRTVLALSWAYDYRVMVVTAHGTSATCVHEKQQWMNMRCESWGLPELTVVGLREKWYLSQKGRLLVDDSLNQVMRWKNEGGSAFLYPSFCNHLHKHTDEAAYNLEAWLHNQATIDCE